MVGFRLVGFVGLFVLVWGWGGRRGEKKEQGENPATKMELHFLFNVSHGDYLENNTIRVLLGNVPVGKSSVLVIILEFR